MQNFKSQKIKCEEKNGAKMSKLYKMWNVILLPPLTSYTSAVSCIDAWSSICHVFNGQFVMSNSQLMSEKLQNYVNWVKKMYK